MSAKRNRKDRAPAATAKTGATQWERRIIGEGEEAPDQLLANPRNWRLHPDAQQRALAGALDQLGWLARITVNRTTGHLVDGHLRVALAMRRGEVTVPVQYVELSEAEERLALATLDPIAAAAVADDEQLRSLLAEVSAEDEGLADLLEKLEAESAVGDVGSEPEGELSDKYTRTITTPIYQITGERPDVTELVDTSRSEQLLADIEAAAADIPADVLAFLRAAATRHNVFNYSRIAEFYAHADEAVKQLFEQSALVIIDFDRAIELGYVEMTDHLMALAGENAAAAGEEGE